MALLLARRGRFADAARLIGYIDGSQTEQSVVQSPSMRRSYDDACAIVGPALDAYDYHRLRAQGCAMTEDEATALALPENDKKY